MQHGGGCGVTPTILLASITLVVANLLRWAAASWAVYRKQKQKGERRKAKHFVGRKNVRRGRVRTGETTLSGKPYGQPRQIAFKLSEKNGKTEIRGGCPSRRMDRPETTTRESQCSGRSAVDQSSVKDAVTWRTSLSTYVFNTKILSQTLPSFVRNRRVKPARERRWPYPRYP
jgi:hypothetical protein